jgi:hypothetical protein
VIARNPSTSWTLVPAIGLAGLATGTASIWLPQLPDNGKRHRVGKPFQDKPAGGRRGSGGAQARAYRIVHPGRCGGRNDHPALSTGTAAGASVAIAVNQLGGQASIAMAALIGGAAVLGVTQNAPLFAAVFTAEFTHPSMFAACSYWQFSARTPSAGPATESPLDRIAATGSENTISTRRCRRETCVRQCEDHARAFYM